MAFIVSSQSVTERKGNKGHAKCEGKIPEKGRQGGERESLSLNCILFVACVIQTSLMFNVKRTAFILTEDKGRTIW